MLPAYKLKNIELPALKIELEGIRRQYTIGSKGLIYFDLDNKTKEILKEIFIPKIIRDKFDVVLMHIISEFILPHTDSDTNSVINLYLNCDEGITYFYDIVKDCPEKMNGQTVHKNG